MQTPTDSEKAAQKIEAAQAGDRQAFAELVRMHESMLRTFALYRLPYPEEAAEAVQDTFVRAFEQLAEFRAGTDFGTWLRSICRFMILSRVKTYTRQKAKHDDYKQQIAILAAQHIGETAAFRDSEDDLLAHLTTCRKGLSETNQATPRRPLHTGPFHSTDLRENRTHRNLGNEHAAPRPQRAPHLHRKTNQGAV